MARRKAQAESTEPVGQPGIDAAIVDSPPADAQILDTRFLERLPGEDGDVKHYEPEANPRSWSKNNIAGVEFRTHRDPYEAELASKDKPSQAVIDYLKDSGFKWNSQVKVWTRPIGYETQAQDRLHASRFATI